MRVSNPRLGSFRRKLALVAAMSLLLPASLAAKNYKLQNDPTVPGATGEVKTGKDRNGNTKIELKVKYLAQPSQLTPPKTTYMVWIQQSGMSPDSQGMLKVNDKLEGQFQTSTPAKSFDLLITAESDPMTKAPTGTVVLRANGVTR
jgi:hypothetical protein